MKHIETAAKARLTAGFDGNPEAIKQAMLDFKAASKKNYTGAMEFKELKRYALRYLDQVNKAQQALTPAQDKLSADIRARFKIKACLAETAAKMHPWAVAMLNVVQGIIPKGSGFVGDMSSSDGAYVDAKTAAKIVNAFKEDGHKVTNFSGGFNKPGGSTSIDSKDDSQCGITVSDDDGDKVLTFFDQNS